MLERPAIERGVVNLHPALLHHFLDLAVADWMRHVPADAPQNNVPFKRTAMRSDKTDTSFTAMIYLGSAIINSR
jgi:hypothetical protein